MRFLEVLNKSSIFFFQVAEKLHARADMNTSYKYDFINLASRVEEFTLRLLDAFHDLDFLQQYSGRSRALDVLVETAINLDQKKVHCKAQCNFNGCNIVGL